MIWGVITIPCTYDTAAYRPKKCYTMMQQNIPSILCIFRFSSIQREVDSLETMKTNFTYCKNGLKRLKWYDFLFNIPLQLILHLWFLIDLVFTTYGFLLSHSKTSLTSCYNLTITVCIFSRKRTFMNTL